MARDNATNGAENFDSTAVQQKLDETSFVTRFDIDDSSVKVFIDARTSRGEQEPFIETVSEMGLEFRGRNTHDHNWGNGEGTDEYLLLFKA